MWPKNLTDHAKVIIFDCDGVMFDSRNANVAFYNAILAHFKKPLLTEEGLAFVHMSTAEESIKYLFQGDSRCEQAQQYRKQVDYSQFIPFMTMEPFLEEVLEGLKKKYKLAVATNRSNTIRPLLKIFKIGHFFDRVVSALDVANPKPHPESILKIVNHFGIEPHEVIFIGDSSIDKETALQAKVFFVAYKNPLLKADYAIDDLRALLLL